MQKLLKNKHIDKNSWIHFGICFGLSAIGGLFGASAAVGGSLTKEYCDKLYYGHWCWTDLAFDAAGIVTGLAANYGLLKLFGVL